MRLYTSSGYGYKSCGYCHRTIQPYLSLRSSGTCSERCEKKRRNLMEVSWDYLKC